jgi:hypothetical protein
MAALIVLGLAAGLAGAVGVRQRAGLIDGLTSGGAAQSVAAQNLYRALSDADATAASAFLSNGLEPAALRERYQADIADATAALAVVSAGDTRDARRVTSAAQITAQLPVYTGLIETARAYNRQGLPLGAAYLREASGLMRGKLLPAAQQLYGAVAREVDEARSSGSAFPWFALLLGLSSLAGLVAAQRYLHRRTNRVVNVGLVLATVGAVVLIGWLGVSAFTAAGRLEASRDNGSAHVNRLAEARILALQARADEALTLVARGSGAAFEQDYTAVLQRLVGPDGTGGLLGEAQTAATDAATRDAAAAAAARARDWLAVHRQLRGLDDNGRYAEAVALAVGSDPGSAAAVFGHLDTALGGGIAHSGEVFAREAGHAGQALSGVDVGVAVLTVLVVVGVALGIQRRLAEYR